MNGPRVEKEERSTWGKKTNNLAEQQKGDGVEAVNDKPRRGRNKRP